MTDKIIKSWLTEKIREPHPTFCPEKAAEYKNATFIRQWASGFIRWATRDFLLKHEPWPATPLADIIQDFEDDKGGVWCGGAATFLNKIYEIFGVKSAGFDFGINDPRKNFSHLANCVLCIFQKKEIFCYQDCYFNIGLSTRDEKPLDLRLLIPLVQSGKVSEIIIQEGELPIEKYAIFSEKECSGYTNFLFGEKYKKVEKIFQDGRFKVKVRFYGTEFLNFMLYAANGTPFREKLRSEKLPVDIRSLFCFPRGFSGQKEFRDVYETLLRQAAAYL